MTIQEEGLRSRMASDYMIGCFKRRVDNSAYFTDIRGVEGDIINYPPDSESDIIIEYLGEKQLVENKFYQFEWFIHNDAVDTIVIKGEVLEVEQQEFIQRLYDARYNLKGKALEDSVNNQKTILSEVTGAKNTYIYELLQNANDYPYGDQSVHVQFTLTEHYLFFSHSGDYFNLRNIVGICSVNQGEKRRNTKTIGYKGIGFKTVFVNNEYVYLRSGDWKLRFDRSHLIEDIYGKRPWTIMPIPTSDAELGNEVLTILSNEGSDMRVQFALRHKNNAKDNLAQLDKVFGDNQILLFIPNVNRVDVVVDNKSKYIVEKDPSKWIVADYEYVVPDDLKEEVNRSIESDNKIPEKFKDIDVVSISFAVGRRDSTIIPVENARVYNYLPTERTLGFKFLINADFIPNGSRSDLHNVEWNNRIMQQCGVQFAEWWVSLLQREGEYDLQSVFDILPESYRSKDHYTSLFLKGFKERIVQIPCIPVLVDGEYRLCKMSQVIYDETQFICTSEAVVTDEEFYQFYNKKAYLPHPDIRCSEQLEELMHNFDLGFAYTGNDISNLCLNNLFLQWLENKDNNIKFISYLVQSGYITNCLSYKIFLSSDGVLSNASSMYYNIDKYIVDINFLGSNLPRLDSDIRNALESKYESWNSYRPRFKNFEHWKFVASIFKAFDSYVPLFHNLENSVSFIHYLSMTNNKEEIPSDYPFFADNGDVVTSRSNIFQLNDVGVRLSQQSWMSDGWVNFIHPDYLRRDERSVCDFLASPRCAIISLTEEECYKKFIAHNKYVEEIAVNIQDRQKNIDLYRYLSSIKDKISQFTPMMRDKYTLFTTDGETDSLTSVKRTIFKQDDEWLKMANIEWMPAKYCLAIVDDYYQGLDDVAKQELQTLFTANNLVQTYSVKGLFSNTLRQRINSIAAKIVTKELSRSFLNFLFDNRQLLFKDGKIDLPVKVIPIQCIDREGLMSIDSLGGENLYTPNNDAMELYQESWFNKDMIYLLDPFYADLFDGRDRCDFFNFSDFGIRDFKKVHYLGAHLLCHIDRVESNLIERANNIAFHRYFSHIHEELTERQFEPIKNLPIYLSSPTGKGGVISEKSSGHYLPSSQLEEIISLDIFPISILGSIHPDYIESEQDIRYFTDKLKNAGTDSESLIKQVIESDSIAIQYLKDEDRNCRFWRWAYSMGADIRRSELKIFPIMSREYGDDIDTFSNFEKLYISDTYADTPNFESFVNLYVNDARFVSSIYQVEGDDNRAWRTLFRAVNVKVDNKDIIFKSVIPDLGRFKSKSIIPTLAQYVDDIAKQLLDEDRKMVEYLSRLQFHCVDGEYRVPEDVMISGKYFDIDNNPFVEVNIEYMVSECYIDECKDNEPLRRDIVKFVKLIADTFKYDDSIGAGCEKCETLTQLRDAKIWYFGNHQEQYLDGDAHFSIIAQLADAYIRDAEGVRLLIKELGADNILLYTTNRDFIPASELYLSSGYNPNCDYMANGITELSFVSEHYANVSTTDFRRLFNALGLSEVFSERNITLLRNRRFAIYFWNVYAHKNEAYLKYICTPELLSDQVCIPTVNGIKKPSELYDNRNPQLKKIVLKLSSAENLLPYINIPQWVERIGLRHRLYLVDSLEYLNLETNDFRRSVLEWITDTPEDIIAKNSAAIEQYKQNAKWYNGVKEWSPLSGLVAIAWGNKTLRDNFGGNEYICNPSFMPETQTDFNKLCALLGIKILTDSDFKKEKGGEFIADNNARSEISKRLVYLAWKSGNKKWGDINKEYQERLSRADISSCELIDYLYNENIKTDLEAYTESPDALWYVGEWQGAMFLDVLEWIKLKIGIKDGFDDNFLRKLFRRDFTDFVKDQEGGKLPEELILAFDNIDVTGIAIDDSAYQEEFIEDDYELDDDSIDVDKDCQQPVIHIPILSTPTSSNFAPVLQNDYNAAPKTERRKSAELPKPPMSPVKSPDERAPLSRRLQDEWEQRKNRTVGRPASTLPNDDVAIEPKSNIPPAVEEPFFSEPKPEVSKSINLSDMAKASRAIKRKNTEAKDIAEKAQDQEELLSWIDYYEDYTYVWYKILMKLQNDDNNKAHKRTVQIDFFDYKLLNKNTVLSLLEPSVLVPKWIEDSDIVELSIFGKSTKLKAELIRVTEYGVEFMIDPSDVSKLNGARKIRVSAESSTNIIDSLTDRFIQLDYSDDFNLRDNLPSNIEFIYGPPGTGKTTRLVEILHNIVSGSDIGVNVLVLTPTNKAADVITERVAKDPNRDSYLCRFGSTESLDIIQMGLLKTRDTIDMSINSNNIVAMTAARYSYDCMQPDDVAVCDYNWDYIIVDEASMIDLVTITYILHKGKDSKIIIAGDPKQIEPIERNNIPAQNIYHLVGLDSFAEAISGYDRFPVESLTTQYRSIPTIGNMVSKFAYNGKLNNDPNRSPQKPLALDGIAIKDINFVGFKCEPLDRLYGATAVNNSAFHLYAALFTYNMVEYVVKQIEIKYPGVNYTIGVVCPYGAQARAMSQLLDNRPLDSSNCKVVSGTVHKFQGDECDIMFIVLNPPMNITSGTHIKNDNIINVAMSRARDYIFFVMPEGQLDGYDIKNRLGAIIPKDQRMILKCSDIEDVMSGDKDYIYNNTNITCHMPVNVYYGKNAKYEVRIDDMNVDIELDVD